MTEGPRMAWSLPAIAKWVVAVVAALWLSFPAVIKTLISVMAMDFMAGFMVAALYGQLSSKVAWRGLWTKLGVLLLLLMLYVVGTNSGISGLSGLSDICAIGFVMGEMISVIRNCAALGVPIPITVVSMLAAVKRVRVATPTELARLGMKSSTIAKPVISKKMASAIGTNSETEKARHVILLVEDNAGDVTTFLETMEVNSVHQTVVVMSDGEKAMEHIEAVGRGEEELPELVVLDLNLPKVGGIDILRRLRRDPGKWDDVPVVIMSSSYLDREMDECKKLGVVRYIRKANEWDGLVRIGKEIKDLLKTALSKK